MKTTKILLTTMVLATILALCAFAAPSVADVADVVTEQAPEQTVTLAETVSSGTCGDNLTWTLDDEGTLTVSGSGAMTDWSYSSDRIKKVVIGDSVTSIGDWAFYNCTSLTSIEIPNSVTSIGGGAFYGCTSLTSVDIGDSVTSIGGGAFNGCTSLTSVEIGDSVTSIGGSAFYGCTSLTSVDIPDSVTSIGDQAFDRCRSLTSIEIPNSVTSIGDQAFYNCTSLTSVEIGESVTSIGGSAFYNTAYYNDEENWEDDVLYISNCLISAKASISGQYKIKEGTTLIADCAFYDCTSLTSVDIPDSVTSIGDQAFDRCRSLTSIEIPNSVTSIGWSAFNGCTSLTSVDIGDSVTSIGDKAFYNTAYYNDEENWEDDVLYISNCLISAKASMSGQYKIKEGTTLIADCAFYDCTSLTSVEIGDSVKSIGKYAFSYCTSLTSVEIGDSVTSIGWSAFDRCSSLTSIEIPDSVTSIGSYAFYNCTSLTSVDIGDSVTSIGDHAFYYCTSLTSVDIPDSVTSVGDHAFYYCSSLTKAIILRNVVSIGYKAFYGCPDLTIYGYRNSYAETYANANNIPFVALDVSEYSVSFKYTDGTQALVVTKTLTVFEDYVLTDSDVYDVEHRSTPDDYKFLGWSETVDGTDYKTSQELRVSIKDLNGKIYYAQFEEIEYTYPTVSFEYANGDEALPTITKTLSSAEDYILTATDVYDVEHPTKPEDYKFLGWSEEANGTDYKTSQELRVSIKDLNGKTFYAQFEKVKHTYTVSFKFDTDMEALPTVTKTLSASEDYVLTAADVYDVEHPEQPDDYEFIGWADSTDWLSSEELRVSIKELDGKTYYAQFNEIQRHYLVFFLPNGGENGPDFQVKWEGEDITLTTDIPTRDGYEFVGWAKDPDATQAEYFPGDLYTADEFIYLYAVWKQIPVEYDVYVYSEPSQAWAYTRYNVTFTISLEGTYDGYSFTVPKTVDGLTITNISAKDGGYVDDMGEVYMISVLGGKMREDSAKLAVLTVEATVNADAPAGFVSLPLTNAMISNEMGEAAVSKCIVTPLEIKDRILGDINDDGVFDYYDVSKIFALYRRKTTVPDYIDVDINRDGVFDYFDVSKLFAIYRGKASFN